MSLRTLRAGSSRSQSISTTQQKNPTAGTSKNGAQKNTAQQNRSEVAFLEPCDFEIETASHPVAIGKILAQERFTKCKEITKVGRFRFKLTLERKEVYPLLEKIKFEKYNLKLFVPTTLSQTICFVRGVPQEYEEEEIRQYASADVTIIKVERIMRRIQEENDWKLVPTNNVKVIVQGSKVPESFKIYGCPFRVELYVFPVKQCQKCWKFGHTQKFCRGKEICRQCSSEHPKDQQCTKASRCVNCGGKHQAADKVCKERKRRENILNTMRKEGLTYVDAETKFPKLSNRFALLDTESDTDFPVLDVADEEGTETADNRKDRYNERPRPKPRNSNRDDWDDLPTTSGDKAYNVTVVETVLARVRQDLIRQLRSRSWLKPLIDLRDEIARRMQRDADGLEVDQLIVYIFGRINEIITEEDPPHQEKERRIEQGIENGQ